MGAPRSAYLSTEFGQRTQSLRVRLWAFLLDPAVVLNGFLVVAILTRLYGSNIALTSDEAYWMQRTLRFGAALVRGDFEMTFRSGHPGVTVMWTGLAGVGPDMLQHFSSLRFTALNILERDPAYLHAFVAARYAIILTTSGLLTLAVALLWRLLGREAALLGGALLLLDPYVVAMTRLLHVDALLGLLMAVSALAGLIWWRDGRRRYLAASAVAGGLALLTKAPAAYLPIYFSGVGLVYAWKQQAVRRWLGSSMAWGVLALATYIACWPAMWANPFGTAQAIVTFALREGGQPHNWSNYFLGAAVTTDPGPLFYPVALGLRLGPLVLLGLLATVVIAAKHRGDVGVVHALAWYALGFMVIMNIGGKKFDRYMLPAIIVLDLLAGVGLWVLLTWLKRIAVRRAIITTMLAVQATLLWKAYPYPLAYYNPLLGGATTARQTLIVGWGEGLEEVAAYLNRQPNAERLVASTLYHHALRPLFRGQTVRIVEPLSPDYFVLYVNMEQRQLTPPGLRLLLESRTPEYTVSIQGVEYAQVYRLPRGLPVYAPDQAPMPPSDEEETGDEPG